MIWMILLFFDVVEKADFAVPESLIVQLLSQAIASCIPRRMCRDGKMPILVLSLVMIGAGPRVTLVPTFLEP